MSADAFTFRRAVRGRFSPLIMIAGPAGTGKTFSALRLATGMAGAGKVLLADTDNARSLIYADAFEFYHLDLREPFRPERFEEAAIAANEQGAAVLVIDSFSAEHAGPGGLLDYHEDEIGRLTKGDENKRDQMNMVAWIRPKLAHKRMRERLYQLNIPIVLCCAAERKVAMVRNPDRRGRIEPIDIGFQPVCASDIPYAMTVSLLLDDVAHPGVPTPIKALLPALQPIIGLNAPLDEATGTRIAAWARGEAVSEPANPTGAPAAALSPPARPARKAAPDDKAIEDGARALAARFDTITTIKDHDALVTEPGVAKQLEWLRKNRKALYDGPVKTAIDASLERCLSKRPELAPSPKPEAAQTGLDLESAQS